MNYAVEFDREDSSITLTIKKPNGRTIYGSLEEAKEALNHYLTRQIENLKGTRRSISWITESSFPESAYKSTTP